MINDREDRKRQRLERQHEAAAALCSSLTDEELRLWLALSDAVERAA